jgi:hypothetical protein
VGEGESDNGRDQDPLRGPDRKPDWASRVSSVSVDWWATAVAGVIVALAVADVLPKIPW